MNYSKPNDSYSAQDILKLVSEKSNIDEKYLTGKCKPKTGARRVAEFRCITALLIRRKASASLEEVGRYIGIASQREVLEMCKKAMSMVGTDTEASRIFAEIDRGLKWQRAIKIIPIERQRTSIW